MFLSYLEPRKYVKNGDVARHGGGSYLQELLEAHKDQGASTFRAVLLLLGIMPAFVLLKDSNAHIEKPWGFYSLLPWFPDVLVGVEEGSNVHCLTAPDMTVDRPIK